MSEICTEFEGIGLKCNDHFCREVTFSNCKGFETGGLSHLLIIIKLKFNLLSRITVLLKESDQPLPGRRFPI